MKKLIIPALAIVVSISALGLTASKVYAYDTPVGQDFRRGFNAIAEFLGMETEDLQTARNEGRTVLDLVEEQGKTQEEFQQYMQDKAVERMQERGFSEEEITERLGMMAQRRAEGCTGTPKGPSGFSMGKGRRLNQ
ncbi:MAG: hypothetical protein ABIA11_01295 [Patescibacteria group bacterium]